MVYLIFGGIAVAVGAVGWGYHKFLIRHAVKAAKAALVVPAPVVVPVAAPVAPTVPPAA